MSNAESSLEAEVADIHTKIVDLQRDVHLIQEQLINSDKNDQKIIALLEYLKDASSNDRPSRFVKKTLTVDAVSKSYEVAIGSPKSPIDDKKTATRSKSLMAKAQNTRQPKSPIPTRTKSPGSLKPTTTITNRTKSPVPPLNLNGKKQTRLNDKRKKYSTIT